ncbi:YceI family protein [Corynebacterium bouchesdurhonense]|uniref:YceI family protein n=1 Tax=Corynebacterium bouchesdurhonense TaxID=1720192 RepID=UPI00082D2994|nr:YceI family protein [Corynebacterium bouchesdurhonense]
MANLHGTWNIDPVHSTLSFVVRHAMVTKVRGSFTDWNATVTVDGDDLAQSRAEASIKVASVDTRMTDRDEHLRSADFFDAEQFPEATFTSTAADIDAEGNGTVTGDLTIKDVTKPVTLKVETLGVAEDPSGETRWGFEASTTIDRTEFGIDFNAPMNSGGLLLSKDIKVEIEGSATRA